MSPVPPPPLRLHPPPPSQVQTPPDAVSSLNTPKVALLHDFSCQWFFLWLFLSCSVFVSPVVVANGSSYVGVASFLYTDGFPRWWWWRPGDCEGLPLQIFMPHWKIQVEKFFAALTLGDRGWPISAQDHQPVTADKSPNTHIQYIYGEIKNWQREVSAAAGLIRTGNARRCLGQNNRYCDRLEKTILSACS